ncbi:hypothetical protein EB74_30045 [Mycobacterium sp. SWH-M5]|uniref:hypothetical protein n=1 Tax=Mycolicibacterium goodii TaxID=134601 RepID=UPI00093EDFA5|nr:hypothetical protein [Mycolicibacterium goodii]MBU8817537.1 hypothetical protein [Mycolicibacterium goodii]OKH69408.1 hypothetical protein EB74_30045 [Mycobacterium sp. SWH-M5]
MSVIAHNFEGINGQLDSMQATNQALMAKKEEYVAELHRWASYWEGDAFTAATAQTQQVAAALDAVITASTNYVNKGRMANEEMRAQESANASLWA